MKKEAIKQNPRVLLVGARARLISLQNEYKKASAIYNQTWFFDEKGVLTVDSNYDQACYELNRVRYELEECVEEVRRLVKELEEE